MTGRIQITRKVTSIVDGRSKKTSENFYSCWCEVKSLATSEKYNALQIGLDNTIVFEEDKKAFSNVISNALLELLALETLLFDSFSNC